MSEDQHWGADTTTQGPPASYRRERASIVSSSQLSPKSPAPWDSDTDKRSERKSWGEREAERINRRRRSTVTFGGATSVAPSDSISNVKSRSGRDAEDRAGTQYSRRSRRRSAPWQDVDYRSTYQSKAGSSQGGTHGAVSLTEGNLEEFNEKRPPRSERDIEKEVEKTVEVDQLDRKSSAKSRRDSGVSTHSRQSGTSRVDADGRRASRQYSRTERDNTSAPATRTVVTTRRKTEIEDDGSEEEEVETKSKSRYQTYSRASRNSRSQASERRQSRAANVYAQAAERRAASTSGARAQKSLAAFSQRWGPPPTMPPESRVDRKSSRDIEVAAAAAATTGTSRSNGSPKSRPAYVEECEDEEAVQTEAKSERRISRQEENRTRRTEVKSERVTEREVEMEAKSNSSPTRMSGRSKRQSQAPTRPTQAAAATSPSSPSSGPSSATSPTAPSPIESHWERRVHIVETRKPDGRVIMDREVSLRRFSPQQQQIEA